jgi:hypothetical protein
MSAWTFFTMSRGIGSWEFFHARVSNPETLNEDRTKQPID